LLIVLSDPNIEIGLQLVDGTVHLFTKRDTAKFVEHGLLESLTDSIRLRALGLGTGVIDILDREVELIVMPLWVAAVFAAAVGQYAQQLNLMAIEERNHSIIQDVGRR
jgi:hypothetical protein